MMTIGEKRKRLKQFLVEIYDKKLPISCSAHSSCRLVSLDDEPLHKTRFRLEVAREFLQIFPLYGIKAFLLHEVGHLETRCEEQSLSKWEYRANVWALNRARKLKLKLVEEDTLLMFYVWDSPARASCYQDAFKLAVKNGICPKSLIEVSLENIGNSSRDLQGLT